MRKPRGPRATSVDAYVGGRIRERRITMGMSQSVLGELLGLTFQQVQKYEKGRNRVSASVLWTTARALQVPVGWFYEGMTVIGANFSIEYPLPPAGVSVLRPLDNDPLYRRQTLELARAFHKIGDPGTRRTAFELIKALARATGQAHYEAGESPAERRRDTKRMADEVRGRHG